MENLMGARVTTCPNPKCQKKFEQPIFLNNFSTTPAEHYYACPHCFMKLHAYVQRHTNLASLFLTAFGSIILAWVGWLTWYDMTVWGKDITLIFFGPRTGEAISLGIGMKVIYYSLMGLAPLFLGSSTFLRRRGKAIELHFDSTAPEKEIARGSATEVTLRLPKKLVDFLKTQEQNMNTTIEQYLQNSILGKVAADLNASDVLALTPNARAQLIEKYGLKEVLKDS